MQKKLKIKLQKFITFEISIFRKKYQEAFRLKMAQIFIKKLCGQKITFSYLFKQMCSKQFLPLFSNFDLDIWILRVKIYKKHLFLSGDILLHTGRYPAPRLFLYFNNLTFKVKAFYFLNLSFSLKLFSLTRFSESWRNFKIVIYCGHRHARDWE